MVNFERKEVPLLKIQLWPITNHCKGDYLDINQSPSKSNSDVIKGSIRILIAQVMANLRACSGPSLSLPIEYLIELLSQLKASRIPGNSSPALPRWTSSKSPALTGASRFTKMVVAPAAFATLTSPAAG